VQFALVPIHQAARVLQRLGVVVVAEAAVRREAGGDALPAAVHGDRVDVDVDDQIAVGGALVDLEHLALGRGADDREVVVVLGVVLVEHAASVERVEDAIAQCVTQLVLVHPAVQTERGDDVHVVDACLGGHVEHRFHDALARVWPAHLRQRQADVVEGDGQLHAREQQRGQRILVVRVQQRMADGAIDVVERLQWFGRVDDAAAACRQLLEAEVLTAPEQDGWGRSIDLEHESGTRHVTRSLSGVGSRHAQRAAGRRRS
jgi:hypothetical protein